jgi:hypothetical protein
VFADDFENLILLKGLARDVEWQVFRVDDTLDEVEVLRNEVLTVIHNEDTANIEFDVVALFLALKEVEWCTKGWSERTNEQGKTATDRFGT